MFNVQNSKPKVQGLKFGGYLQEAGNLGKAKGVPQELPVKR